MKYLPLLFIFFACGEEPIIDKAALQGSLKYLRQEKDSLRQLKGVEMQKMFEREATTTATALATDTAYASWQKNINRIDGDIKALERRIEETEEEMYKPR